MHFSFSQGQGVDLTNLKSTSVAKKKFPTFNIIQEKKKSSSVEDLLAMKESDFSFLLETGCHLKKKNSKTFYGPRSICQF